MAETLNEAQLLRDLEPTAEDLLNRHLRISREWFPHEYIPFGVARDFEPGYKWKEDDAEVEIDKTTRSALHVNLLTEDNLPYYFRTVERMFGRDGAWGAWVRRWTAEEGRHSMTIYGYLMATRAIDPVLLERGRMAQVSGGKTPEPSLREGFVYLALQELATRISHMNTGKRLNDPVGLEVMNRVGKDENLHQLFYRDLAAAAIKADPNEMMFAMEQQVRTFTMPGAGIPNFNVHAGRIAAAGIYDHEIHYHEILKPVVEDQWKALNISGLNPDAQKAQDSLGERLQKSARVAGRLANRKAAQAEQATASA